jgi:murein L,D-transpeptidase YafK
MKYWGMACRRLMLAAVPPILVLLLSLFWSISAAAEETWILIDTGELTLSVMRGEEEMYQFSNISIGRNGVTAQKIIGDQRTPLGTFRIVRINPESRYYKFFGLDYPSLQYAQRAFETGVIDDKFLDAIRTAHEQGREPPADTPLGGYIGIHGLGNGDVAFHQDFNWTEGCIALSNEEVDELEKWVGLNTLVVIL